MTIGLGVRLDSLKILKIDLCFSVVISFAMLLRTSDSESSTEDIDTYYWLLTICCQIESDLELSDDFPA